MPARLPVRSSRTARWSLLIALSLLAPAANAADQPCAALRFAPARDLVALPDAGTLRAADLDGDGRRDFLVLDRSRLAVRAFLRQADGRYTAIAPLAVAPSSPADLLAADLDGDGIAEGILTGGDGSRVLRLGPDRKLAVGPRAEPPLDLTADTPLATTDLDRDGRSELLALVKTGLMAYRLGVDGALHGQLIAPLDLETAVGLSLVAGDFDGDGNVDVVTTSSGYPSPRSPILWGDGKGGFRQGPSVSFPRMYSVAAADFDGDGRTEFTYIAYGGKYGYWSSSLVRFDEEAGLKSAPAPFGYSGSSAPRVLAGDFDGEGRPDAVGIQYQESRVYRFSSGSFEYRGTLSPFMPDVTADVDGDGHADLVSTVSGTIQVARAECDPAPADATVPVVVSLTGLDGVRFETELAVDLLGGWPEQLEVTYVPSIGEGGGTVSFRPGTKQMFFPSALDALAALGLPVPAEGNRAGTLSIRAPGISLQQLAVTTRVVAVGAGRGGVGFVERPLGSGRSLSAIVGWLRETGGDRSNLAVLNLGTASQGDVVLRVTLFSDEPEGRRAVLPEVRLAPGKLHQWTRVLAGSGMTGGWAFVERLEGTAPFFAYGVVNDEGTGDGSFVPAFEPDRPALNEWVIPAIVETDRYSSDLVVTNTAGEARELSFRLISDALTTYDRTARFTLIVPGGGQLLLADVVERLRGWGIAGVPARGPEIVGALFVDLAGEPSSGLYLGARTSATKPEGRYGVFYEAVRADPAPGSVLIVPDVRLDERVRTNLAIVNLDDSPAAFKLFVHGVDGVGPRAPMDVTVGPRRVVQINSVLGAAGTTYRRGIVDVAVYGRLVRFLAYGITNEGSGPGVGSDDGTLVMGR